MNQFTEQSQFLEAQGVKLFEQMPHLPLEWREFLVKIVPWLALIGGILGVIGLIGFLQVFFSPMGRLMGVYGQMNIFLIVAMIVLAVTTALYFMAFPKLQKNQKSGWDLLFWAELVSIVGAVLGGFAIGQILGALIGLYLLFEIRTYFK